MAAKDCIHEFAATAEKGLWRVKVLSTNNRGTPADEFVITTIYECKKCGDHKEYPDEWEKNYVAPGQLKKPHKSRKKKTIGKKKIRSKKKRNSGAA